MKKTTLKITALLLALLMILSMALVSCDETGEAEDDGVEDAENGGGENKDNAGESDGESDGEGDNNGGNSDNNGGETPDNNGGETPDNNGGNGGSGDEEIPDIGYEGDEIANTKENARTLFNNAVSKFKNSTSVKYTAATEFDGEVETDVITVFTNANGDVVYYEIADIGNMGFEYTYAIGRKEYSKGPWGVDEYNLDEDVTMLFAVEDVFTYIFDTDPETAIENLCTAVINVSRDGDKYVISLDTNNVLEFFVAMLGEEGAQEVVGDGTAFSAFNGKINIEIGSNGYFEKIAFSYSVTAVTESMTMGVAYSFEKYNDPSITVDEPDWVTEKKNEGDDDNSGGAVPDYPDKPVDPDNPGDSEGGASVEDTSILVNALKDVKNSDTLKVMISISNGEESENMIFTAVKGEDGTSKASGEYEGYEMYIDSEGNLYENFSDTVSKTPDTGDAYAYILESYLQSYGFGDIDNVVSRMVNAGLKGVSDGMNTTYTLNTTYVKLTEIISPEYLEDPGFQMMVSMIKHSSVTVVYVIDENGELSRTESNIYIALNDGNEMIIDESVSYAVNKLVRFEEPDWIHNAP